jgi:hypothetical protein
MDQSKKTMRHFYCRDVLWETFEQMANDFDCSIDYLVNESMRYYARSKNYGGGDAKPPTPGSGRDPRMTAPNSPAQTRPQPVTSPPPGPAPRKPPGQSHPPSAAPAPNTAPRSAPASAPAASSAAAPTLFLLYNGQRYTVAKDQFIIGRGSKSSDLAIKDGNISRKHAAVIRRNGTFYIKDLGSTNGIDYKGMRIDNKRIDEGDTFHLCDYELRFTYRGD